MYTDISYVLTSNISISTILRFLLYSDISYILYTITFPFLLYTVYSDGKRSIFRSRSESTIMNGTKNGTIVLNEKTERAVKAAFGAQNFIVNHKMRGESASESIFYNVKLKIIKHILSKRDSF